MGHLSYRPGNPPSLLITLPRLRSPHEQMPMHSIRSVPAHPAPTPHISVLPLGALELNGSAVQYSAVPQQIRALLGPSFCITNTLQSRTVCNAAEQTPAGRVLHPHSRAHAVTQRPGTRPPSERRCSAAPSGTSPSYIPPGRTRAPRKITLKTPPQHRQGVKRPRTGSERQTATGTGARTDGPPRAGQRPQPA